jgi:hypothetical protein
MINEGFNVYQKSFNKYDTYLKLMSLTEFKETYTKTDNKTDKPKFYGIMEISTNKLVVYS